VAYSSKSDIQEILPDQDLAELTDDVNDTPVTVDARVDSAITRADNKINSYLRGKHGTLPLNPVPENVKDWSVSLAIWELYRRRVDLEIPEPVREDKKATIEALESVQDGTTHIDTPTAPANTFSFYKGSGSDKGELFDSNKDGTGCLDQYYNGPVPVTTFRNQ